MLISNEPMPNRAKILSENVERLDFPRCGTMLIPICTKIYPSSTELWLTRHVPERNVSKNELQDEGPRRMLVSSECRWKFG